jgi:hypothetical protein
MHYLHINVALPKKLAEAFKTRCNDGGVSVAGEIARLLRMDLAIPPVAKKKTKPTEQRFNTRLDRRKAMKNIIYQLGEIKDAEMVYLGNMPEQLQETNGEGIDDAVAVLESVIDELSGIDIYPEPPPSRKSTKPII